MTQPRPEAVPTKSSKQAKDFQWFTMIDDDGTLCTVAVCTTCIETFNIAKEGDAWKTHECRRVIISGPIPQKN